MRASVIGIATRRALIAVLALAACKRAPEVGHRPASPAADTTALAAFADSVAAGRFGYVDGMRITRDGALVFAHNFPRASDSLYPMTGAPGPFNYHDPRWHPFYHGTDLHTLQSVTKSVTSIVFGIAVARGDIASLDAPIAPLFPERASLMSDPRKQRITIRNLLTMTSGIRWPEGSAYDTSEDLTGRMEVSEDWVGVVLAQPMEGEPGTIWSYSSGGAALLGAVFEKLTGRDIQDYTRERLFAPLGITRLHWKRSSGGLTDTEGGLYLDLDGLERVGRLVVNGGRWNGQQLVPAAWVTESGTPQPPHALDRRDKKYGYGTLWWTPPRDVVHDPNAFFAWGYGGQYIVLLPATRTVGVMTQWNLTGKGIAPEAFAARVERAVSGGR